MCVRAWVLRVPCARVGVACDVCDACACGRVALEKWIWSLHNGIEMGFMGVVRVGEISR